MTGKQWLRVFLIFFELYCATCTDPTPGDLRLVGEGTTYKGRLEIYYDNVWGTICNDQFGILDANVSCRQLGFTNAISILSTEQFGGGTGNIWLDELRCDGDELTLDACPNRGWGLHDCFHSEDVAILCDPNVASPPSELRLVGGPNVHEGRLEISYYGEWGSVCDDSFGSIDGNVVCANLGFGTLESIVADDRYGKGTGPIWLDDVDCLGGESSLDECVHSGWAVHNCNHIEDVGIICDPPGLRLVGGSEYDGRLEIYHEGVWGSVCDDSFGRVDATVACKQLNLGSAITTRTDGSYGIGTGQIWLDDLGCVGIESSLAECPHRGWGVHDCSNVEDVGIVCSGGDNPADCEETLTFSSGTFASPNYPGEYPNSVVCVTRITARIGQMIQLHFNVFELENGTNCQYDALTIYDSDNALDINTLFGRFCGSDTPPPITSTGNSLYLIFFTDFSIADPGYEAEYRFIDCEETLTLSTGTITSPNYPGVYPNTVVCVTHIRAEIGLQIQLHFNVFKLENGTNCQYDALEIYDGDNARNESTLIGRFCGSDTPPPITSTGNSLYLVFTSDISATYSGYVAQYIFIESSTTIVPSTATNEVTSDGNIPKTPGRTPRLSETSSSGFIIGSIGGATSIIFFVVALILFILLARKNRRMTTRQGRTATDETAMEAVATCTDTALTNRPRVISQTNTYIHHAHPRVISQAAQHDISQFITEEDEYVLPIPVRPLPGTPQQGLEPGMVPWSHFNVSVQELGKGAFGKVYLGHVWSERSNTWNQAAIKVLKPGASAIEEQSFREEFNTMLRIGYHPNVVSLLAAAMSTEGIFHVGLEFVQHGNLRKYLRDYRATGKTIQNYATKQTGDDLTLVALLIYAHDVIKGMRHLLDRQLIHRDLAARNVLLGEDGSGTMVAKVADFGLSRDDDYSKSTTQVKVPVRWMALESVAYRIFSTQSDVWSFGILLYEMVTLGATPYPGIKETRDIVQRLEVGYRMEQPDGCDDDIYVIMSSCWEKDPNKRPTFADLEECIEQKLNLLESSEYTTPL